MLFDFTVGQSFGDPQGGELVQIQFLLGHISIQTAERYLGCEPSRRAARQPRHKGPNCWIPMGPARSDRYSERGGPSVLWSR